ncbi:alpha/beta hydrolase [Rossellomorea aquimaris]|uniref:alpha/beta fold hydrolase n=1 Tax=Rossellomorea aquimaris TaxID=189382 RepID=UPI001CD54859|nr:alpha/beta hydrolase [Rossellomorea aquimaris]MCA1058770.1 alpha/beta hydrolase [Rossellomorea aquimaris]
MKANTMTIQGKGLHVETYGSRANPALLYLHGGPGESCYDFSFHQRDRLSKDLFLVTIDQRGVCRSEAIMEGESFGFQDLIEDCEALRMELGIKRWSILGHSFGGFLALAYVSQYPNSIENVLFECPTFDFTLTSKGLLKKTAYLFEKYNQTELQEQALRLIDEDLSPREFTEIYMKLSDELGENRMQIYTHNFDNPTDYYVTYSEEEWDAFYDRSDYHYQLLREEGIIFSSLLDKIKSIKSPMLLLTGEYDPVTCDEHITTFKRDAQNGEIVHFKQSGHTPHYEEADLFQEVVKNFMKVNSPTNQR